MDEIRVYGYCAECGNRIVDTDEEYYVNSDGEIFCCVECAMEHYGITKIEL